MIKQDILSILITLCAGFVAGVYLYFAGYADFDVNQAIPTSEEVTEFTITSETYGGCRSRCPSFQVTADGSYRYISYTDGESSVVRQGQLPRAILRSLQQSLTETELILQSREITPSSCPSYTDGIDVQYTIILAGTDYVLDSCGTRIDDTSASWQALYSVWQHMDDN